MKAIVNEAIRQNLTTYKELFESNDYLEILTYLGNRWLINGDVSINQCMKAFEEILQIRIMESLEKCKRMNEAITQEPALILSK